MLHTWKYADSKVLSTTTNTSFWRWAISETAAMSTIFNVGLVGVSIHTYEEKCLNEVENITTLVILFNDIDILHAWRSYVPF